jgi:hypothetical protein
VGKSRADRQAARDERLRVEREITDEAIRTERLRADAATGRNGAIIRHQPSLPLNYYQERESHQNQGNSTTREEFPCHRKP